jgi:hypothetical protein
MIALVPAEMVTVDPSTSILRNRCAQRCGELFQRLWLLSRRKWHLPYRLGATFSPDPTGTACEFDRVPKIIEGLCPVAG